MLTGYTLAIGRSLAKERARFAAKGLDSFHEHVCAGQEVRAQLRRLGAAEPAGIATSARGWCIALGRVRRYRAAGVETACRDLSEMEIIEAVLDHGVEAFAKLSGLHAIIIAADGVLYAVAAKTPGPPIYVKCTEGGGLCIASEIKALMCGTLRLAPDAVSEGRLSWAPWQTAFEGVRQVPAGHYLRADLSNPADVALLPYWDPWRAASICSEDVAVQALQASLASAVAAEPADSLVSFISGGLDSGAVTALAARDGKRLRTYSIGTPRHNEFAEARRFADHLGCRHAEVAVTADDILAAFPAVVFAVEHPFSTYLEYLVPGHVGFERVCRSGDTVLSGYGSDVLFAGYAKPNAPLHAVAGLVHNEYRTTLWSNEASHVLGASHGVHVHYPYYDADLVELALSIGSGLKHRDGWEKWILRRAMQDLLPVEVSWRRKIGIHQSTGSEILLTHFVSPDARDLRSAKKAKDALCLRVLELLMVEQCEPADIRMEDVLANLSVASSVMQ